MLRTYKYNGKTWRFEEGKQPEGAVPVSVAAETGQTPETRAAKAPAKRRAARSAQASKQAGK